MITLYHGSNVSIERIDLSRSRRGKNFGCGFYLNPDKGQALDMAIRTARRALEGEPIVNAYAFDERLLLDGSPLSVKSFTGYTTEWAEFVLANRRNLSGTPLHAYDIVTGPIADDAVGLQLRRFTQGYISIERMIEELRFHEPAMQYFFGTTRAVGYLRKVDL